ALGFAVVASQLAGEWRISPSPEPARAATPAPAPAAPAVELSAKLPAAERAYVRRELAEREPAPVFAPISAAEPERLEAFAQASADRLLGAESAATLLPTPVAVEVSRFDDDALARALERVPAGR